MTNTLQSLPELHNLLTTFGQLSLYKFNCSKSNCSLKQNALHKLQNPPQETTRPLLISLIYPRFVGWQDSIIQNVPTASSSLLVPYPPSSDINIPTGHIPINSQQLHLDGRHPRMKNSIMCTPTSKAGMGAPKLRNYYKAILLN